MGEKLDKAQRGECGKNECGEALGWCALQSLEFQRDQGSGLSKLWSCLLGSISGLLGC